MSDLKELVKDWNDAVQILCCHESRRGHADFEKVSSSGGKHVVLYPKMTPYFSTSTMGGCGKRLLRTVVLESSGCQCVPPETDKVHASFQSYQIKQPIFPISGTTGDENDTWTNMSNNLDRIMEVTVRTFFLMESSIFFSRLLPTKTNRPATPVVQTRLPRPAASAVPVVDIFQGHLLLVLHQKRNRGLGETCLGLMHRILYTFESSKRRFSNGIRNRKQLFQIEQWND